MLETTTHRFADRHAAGRALGERFSSSQLEDPVVLGLARGGVPVAYEVAQMLHAPLDVLVACKIGAPGNSELGIGATAEGSVCVLNHELIRRLPVGMEELDAAVSRARAEVEARVQRYRAGRLPLEVNRRTAIVVDDGLATGGTARAALRAVRDHDPSKLVLAVPVGAPDSVESLRAEADEVICLLEPQLMYAVGLWYEDFEPTSDSEIASLLHGQADDPPPRPIAVSTQVQIPVGDRIELIGNLVQPDPAQGLVIFAHGTGSSRFSPRNRRVARALNERGLATLLLDLLTIGEELDRVNVFDIALLADRLVSVTHWAGQERTLASLPVGYFGASTGAGAALWAAAELGHEIRAVVSRGGRPDLAGGRLTEVSAPVLLIVGERDELVLELNREARARLRAPSELAIVPGATHLFEEPGALKQVSRLAGDWFKRHMDK